MDGVLYLTADQQKGKCNATPKKEVRMRLQPVVMLRRMTSKEIIDYSRSLGTSLSPPDGNGWGHKALSGTSRPVDSTPECIKESGHNGPESSTSEQMFIKKEETEPANGPECSTSGALFVKEESDDMAIDVHHILVYDRKIEAAGEGPDIRPSGRPFIKEESDDLAVDVQQNSVEHFYTMDEHCKPLKQELGLDVIKVELDWLQPIVMLRRISPADIAYYLDNRTRPGRAALPHLEDHNYAKTAVMPECSSESEHSDGKVCQEEAQRQTHRQPDSNMEEDDYDSVSTLSSDSAQMRVRWRTEQKKKGHKYPKRMYMGLYVLDPEASSVSQKRRKILRPPEDGDDASQLEDLRFSLAAVRLRRNSSSLFYTGLPVFHFLALVSFLRPFRNEMFPLCLTDQILMTLMRLKLNLLTFDLAFQFNVTLRQVDEIITFWIDVMSERCKTFTPWLPRAVVCRSVPAEIRNTFPNTTCVIDYMYSFMMKPNNFLFRGMSYRMRRQWLRNHSVKMLVVFAPTGLIMFISGTYESKCSDRYVMSDSTFLDCLAPGDKVLAYRPFAVKNLLEEQHHVTLNTPVLACRRRQRTAHIKNLTDGTKSIRQAIRRLQTFKVLSLCGAAAQTPTFHKLLKICAALVNLRSKVILPDN
ncbi:uncharacterized protein LOC114782097 isoform X3 [Denticeps clupeoides]|uniref:uncharacterized protein LOC114782097 isoform X3 n=1 Tax=Denticeps clupeoides TaxID=299321 RepID=UPI0010A39EF6|nr:uncharacterized protein LOC114782097 isoform X3 [Denticeps clupeoides]